MGVWLVGWLVGWLFGWLVILLVRALKLFNNYIQLKLSKVTVYVNNSGMYKIEPESCQAVSVTRNQENYSSLDILTDCNI